MLAGPWWQSAGIHGDGYAEAGLPGARRKSIAQLPGFRIMELLFQHT
jgi:hypothetical protein